MGDVNGEPNPNILVALEDENLVENTVVFHAGGGFFIDALLEARKDLDKARSRAILLDESRVSKNFRARYGHVMLNGGGIHLRRLQAFLFCGDGRGASV